MRTSTGEIRTISLSAEQLIINNEPYNILLHHDITEHQRIARENQKLLNDLGERVKELTALHRAASILQQGKADFPALLEEIVSLLPPAFQYPELTAARVRLGDLETVTPGFSDTHEILRADFATADGHSGCIEVVYTEECPAAAEGPFLLEERELIQTLADMLRTDYDRRQSEGALRESEQRFRQLTDNMREVLWLYTPDYSKALYISAAYETIWGQSRASLYENPHSFLEAVHPDDRQRVEKTISEERESGYDYQYRLQRADGSVRWIWDRGFPIVDDRGQVYRIAGIAEDITERKQAEIDLKTSQEQLRALSAKAESRVKKRAGASLVKSMMNWGAR